MTGRSKRRNEEIRNRKRKRGNGEKIGIALDEQVEKISIYLCRVVALLVATLALSLPGGTYALSIAMSRSMVVSVGYVDGLLTKSFVDAWDL